MWGGCPRPCEITVARNGRDTWAEPARAHVKQRPPWRHIGAAAAEVCNAEGISMHLQAHICVHRHGGSTAGTVNGGSKYPVAVLGTPFLHPLLL